MTYDNSGSVDDSGVPAPPPWLQFAEPEPTEAPRPTPPPLEQPASGLPPGAPRDVTDPGTMRGDHPPMPSVPPPHPGSPTGDRPEPAPAPNVVRPEVAAPGAEPPGAGAPRPTGWVESAPAPGAQPPYPPMNHPPQMPRHDASSPQMPPTQMPPAQMPGPAYPQPQGPGAHYGYPMGPPAHAEPHSGPALDEVALIRKARRPPSRGWRRAVHTISAGTINPGESSADVEYKRLLERVNRPVRGDYRIAVLSLKGGVGKTTTAVGLGSTFASLRGDRVIAVDANPDLGTLAQRVPQQTRSTVRDLLADPNVYRYSDVRAHTSQAPSRLEVLASERDPAMAEAFSDEEYRGVMRILQRFYNIIITDCGTGLSHSAMGGVLDQANAIILVSSPAMDGARSAGATLDWLEAHGFGHLVSRAVVVLSSSRPGASTIDTDQLGQHFLTRCRAVHKIPFDDHLSEGAEVDLDLVGKQTRRAFVGLAATIADDFASPATEPFYPS